MKKTLFSIIGTRPQIIKAAIMHSNFLKYKKINHIIIDTGQHYDKKMFKNFIQEYNLKSKNIFFLNCIDKSNKLSRSNFNKKITPIIRRFRPAHAIVYGDTMSTLIAAQTMKKNNVKISHIESGARSFDKRMIEEKVRKKVDHISNLLFCCTKNCKNNLINENINKKKIFLVGDILYDIFLKNKDKLKKKNIQKQFNLLTLHRRENLYSKKRLSSIFDFLIKNSRREILFPAHPHTIKKINQFNMKLDKKIKIISPVNHIKLLNFIKNSDIVFTDSGGVQREAYFQKKKAIILRDKVEWVDILRYGKQVKWKSNLKFGSYTKNLLGNGNAAANIIKIIFKKIR